jgi:tetratricopeptide (TPR) repeat protein
MGQSGRLAAAVTHDGREVVLHDLVTGADTTLDTAGTSTFALRFSPDERWLVSSGVGMGTIMEFDACLWDLRAPKSPPKKLVHADRIFDLQFSPDSRWLATGTKGQVAQVWNVESGRPECNPIFVARNVVRSMRFSPDSRLLAVHCGDATLRVYDWREACPVSQVLDVQSNLVDLAFSPDGTRLVTASMNPDGASQGFARVFEICPPQGSQLDLVALTEAATALKVSTTGLPVACDPCAGWERFRAAMPESWFFQSPARRSISPAFTASSLRWIQHEAIGINQTGSAMPAVSMVRAAMSFWREENVKKRLKALESMDPESEDAVQEMAELRRLQGTVNALSETAARGASDDASTCLWLSLQRETAGEMDASRKYIDDALRLAPDDREILNQASDVYSSVKDCEAEFRVLTRLRELEPEVLKHRGRLGYNRWRCGERTSAQKEFAAILDDPAIKPEERAEMLICLGRPKEALVFFDAEAARERAAGGALSENTLLKLIISQHLSGSADAAVATFQTLIAKEPRAAERSAIEALPLMPDFSTALLAALDITLQRHPELTPKPEAPK